MVDDTTATPNRRQHRRQVTADIMSAARRQLAEVGAAGLSVRSIAREVGMVSSAVYRYVESRDELLTRLIIAAYDALGTAVERSIADTPPTNDLDRWMAAGNEARRWARQHPHDYLLLFGSPVPGYAAPEGTAGPGTRVPRALAGVVGGAHAAGRLADIDHADPPTSTLSADLDRLRDLIELPIPHAHLVALIAGWTQIFGLISFELTNQTRGIVEDHAGLFEAATRQAGRHVGLR